METFYISKFDSCNRQVGYNIRKGGSRGKHSEETKNKMSVASKGKAKSSQHIQNMSKTFFKSGAMPWNKDKIHSEETKNKISKSRKGKTAGEKHHNAKITKNDVLQIRKLHNEGVSYSKLVKIFNLSKSNISKIVTNKIWKNI